MKISAISAVQACALLVFVLSGMVGGCASETPEATGSGTMSNVSHLLELVSPEWDLIGFVDVQTLRDLETAHGLSNPMMILSNEDAGVRYDDPDRALWVQRDERVMVAYQGQFHLERIREEIARSGHKAGEYLGIEVWDHPVFDQWVALTKGLILSGDRVDVKQSIELLENGGDNLSDDPIVRDLLRSLVGGFYLTLVRGEAIRSYSEAKDGLTALGVEHSLGPDGKVTMMAAYMFRGHHQAQNAVVDIRQEIQEGKSLVLRNAYMGVVNCGSPDVVQSHDRVDVAALVDAEGYFASVNTSTPESTVNEYLSALANLDPFRAVQCATPQFAFDIDAEIDYFLYPGTTISLSNIKLDELRRSTSQARFRVSYDIDATLPDETIRERRVNCFEIIKQGGAWLIEQVSNTDCRNGQP